MTRTHRMLSEALRRQGVRHANEKHFHPSCWDYGYTADIYLPQYHVVIEVDGPSHNGRERRDRIRDKKFSEDLSIKTIRIKDAEIEPDADRVVLRLISRLNRFDR
jgi:very-short-patch-repair endonuclease